MKIFENVINISFDIDKYSHAMLGQFCSRRIKYSAMFSSHEFQSKFVQNRIVMSDIKRIFEP